MASCTQWLPKLFQTCFERNNHKANELFVCTLCNVTFSTEAANAHCGHNSFKLWRNNLSDCIWTNEKKKHGIDTAAIRTYSINKKFACAIVPTVGDGRPGSYHCLKCFKSLDKQNKLYCSLLCHVEHYEGQGLALDFIKEPEEAPLLEGVPQEEEQLQQGLQQEQEQEQLQHPAAAVQAPPVQVPMEQQFCVQPGTPPTPLLLARKRKLCWEEEEGEEEEEDTLGECGGSSAALSPPVLKGCRSSRKRLRPALASKLVASGVRAVAPEAGALAPGLETSAVASEERVVDLDVVLAAVTLISLKRARKEAVRAPTLGFLATVCAAVS